MKTSNFISVLLNNCRNPEPINNKSDYTRVKRWTRKASSLYTVFSIIAIVVSVMISCIMREIVNVPLIAVLFVAVFTAWGFASMFLNFKLLIKSLWSSGTDGYRVGEQIQTKHIDIQHEYGNTYKVSTHIENEGCALALIYGFINLIVWAVLCVYVCPFLTFKKISKSKRHLRKFRNTRR